MSTRSASTLSWSTCPVWSRIWNFRTRTSEASHDGHDRWAEEQPEHRAEHEHQRSGDLHAGLRRELLGADGAADARGRRLDGEHLGDGVAALLRLHERVHELAHGRGGRAPLELDERVPARAPEVERLQDEREL